MGKPVGLSTRAEGEVIDRILNTLLAMVDAQNVKEIEPYD